MSKIAVNEITDEVGTGAPAFPNGMSVTGATLTDPEITGGIYLGGTGSANYLEDYEEGTWTPVLSNFDTWSSPTFDATYTKVGRTVHIRLKQTGGTLGWSAFDAIGGLPFNAALGSTGYATDTSPDSDNGVVVPYTNGQVYFQKANSNETALIFSAVYQIA